MSGNTFGKIFKVTTFGESHGKALGCIIDGCPPNLKIDESDIQRDLDRRKPGQSKYTTQRKEDDKIEILSGVFNGLTTGTPIALLIYNKDHKSKDYSEIKNKFRPGHADFTYQKKYGIRDYRGAGRSSARETVARVAAGAIAKKYLSKINKTKIFGYVSQLGEIKAESIKISDIEKNPFFFPDKKKILELEEYLTGIRKAGDSIGAKVTIIGKNIPIGLGEPVFDKLDAMLAQGMMSINAVKGVEIGAGFDVINQRKFELDEEAAAPEMTPEQERQAAEMGEIEVAMMQKNLELMDTQADYMRPKGELFLKSFAYKDKIVTLKKMGAGVSTPVVVYVDDGDGHQKLDVFLPPEHAERESKKILKLRDKQEKKLAKQEEKQAAEMERQQAEMERQQDEVQEASIEALQNADLDGVVMLHDDDSISYLSFEEASAALEIYKRLNNTNREAFEKGLRLSEDNAIDMIQFFQERLND